jgi:glycosyltransferase involved in cell wall biosynthesis
MRILQIIQKPQLRGAEIFASQLSNHLLDAGHEVKMMALLSGDAALPFKGELIRLNRPLKKRFFDWKGWKELSNVIKEFGPDVIQANAGDTLKFAILSKIFYRWKTPVVFRNANKISDFMTTPLKLKLNDFFVRRLSYVISVSELCKNDFKAIFHFPDNKITCVPIGVERSVIDIDLTPDVKPYFNNRPVFIHVGSFVREKNHEGLIDIFYQVSRENSSAVLLLAGDGPLRRSIQQKVISLGLEKQVHFLGYRSDVLTLVKNADAFLLPSLVEGLPGAILESFYAQTPVVAYNVGGISEVLNKDTGFLIQKGNQQQFAKAILDIVSKPELKSELTDQALQLVISKYDNVIISNKFLSIYKTLSSR